MAYGYIPTLDYVSYSTVTVAVTPQPHVCVTSAKV